jgi:hypothetical protein
VPINLQIGWHVIPPLNELMQQDHAIAVVCRKAGSGSAYASLECRGTSPSQLETPVGGEGPQNALRAKLRASFRFIAQRRIVLVAFGARQMLDQVSDTVSEMNVDRRKLEGRQSSFPISSRHPCW